VSRITAGILATVALAALLGCGSLAWWWLSPAVNPGVDEGRAVAESFLSKLRDGGPKEAWESTTAEFKSAEGREKFVARVKANAWLREPMEYSSSQEVKVTDVDRLEFVFTGAKSGKPVRMLLGREQGQWKVDRLSH
jgi:hypothetical protein